MRGIRTQENAAFRRFFSIVQTEAAKRDAVFFADAGDGHNFADGEIECEDLMGWLVPYRLTEKFEPLWLADRVDDSWTKLFVWAVWGKRKRRDNGAL